MPTTKQDATKASPPATGRNLEITLTPRLASWLADEATRMGLPAATVARDTLDRARRRVGRRAAQ